MKRIMVVVSLAALVAGCAFLGRVKEDYNLNKNTPLSAGEVSPKDQARALTNTISGIPYANLAAPIVALGAPFVFGWLRGRRLRKNGAESKTSPTVVDKTLQVLNDARTGLFEVGPDGSALKRGWKIGLISTLGLFLAPEIGKHLIPFISANHPAWLNGAALSFVIGALAGLEKKLSNQARPSDNSAAPAQ